jgi:beta-phosphoglucomutase-like phosphatase (HAD superfamily)
MKLEALIFDVDGTLVDTEELHRQAYNQTFLDFGFGWEWNADRYAELLNISGGQARIARYIDMIDLPPAEKIRLRRIIPAIHKEKTRLYGELAASNTVLLRPGVARLIGEAQHAGIPVGFVASSASANVDTLISSTLGRDLRKAVGPIVCGDMVTRKKPAPDVYELILTMLRASTWATVAFEDSTNGLMAAKAVGLYTIVTPSRWTMAQTFQGADIVLASLGDPDKPLDAADRAKIAAPYVELSTLEKLRSVASPALKLTQAGS